MTAFGEAIKRLREERGLTQIELSYRSRVNPSTINLVEHGKRNPSTTTLSRIAEALDVDIVEFFPPKENAPASDHVNEAGGNAQFRTGGSHVEPITGSSSATVTVSLEQLRTALEAVEEDRLSAKEAEAFLVAVG